MTTFVDAETDENAAETKETLAGLKVGKELDLAVAHARGWRVQVTPEGGYRPVAPDGQFYTSLLWHFEDGVLSALWDMGRLNRPSTDPRHALDLLAEGCKRWGGGGVTWATDVEGMDPEDTRAWAAFFPAAGSDHDVYDTGKTVEEAICRAFLEAKRYEKTQQLKESQDAS